VNRQIVMVKIGYWVMAWSDEGYRDDSNGSNHHR